MSDKISYDVAEAIVEKALLKIGRLPNDPELHLSRKVFGDLMFESLLICYPNYKLSREDEFTITFEKDDDSKLSGRATLDRLFNTFEGSDPARIWHRLVHILIEIQRMVKAFDNPEAITNVSGDALVPLLKLREQVAHWNESLQALPGMPVGKSNGFVSWPVAGEVVMTVAIDTADNYAFVAGPQLKEIGLTADEARDRSLENLRKMLAANRPKTNYREDVVEMSGVGGLASSLILLDDFWQEEALKAKDALAIFAQDYDNLLVVKRSDRRIAAMVALACATRQVKLIFSGAVFIYNQDGMRQATPSDFLL